MTKRLFLIVLFLSALGPTAAQDGDAFQVITVENASSLVEIAALGEDDRSSQIEHIAFSASGEYLIYDTTFQGAGFRIEGDIYVWQLDPLTQIDTFPGAIQGFIDDTQFSYCVGNEMQFTFDISSETIVSESSTGWCGIMDPSGNVIATGEGYYFYLHLRDPDTGEVLAQSEVPAVWRAFSQDGTLLATSSILNDIAIWNVAEIIELDTLSIEDAAASMPHQGIEIGPGGDVAFSPDGSALVYSSLYGVFVWDIQSETVVAELGDNIRADGIAFSPDGELMVNGTRSDEMIRIWDTNSWQQIVEFPMWLVDTAFSPDGTILAIGMADGTLALWGIPDGES